MKTESKSIIKQINDNTTNLDILYEQIKNISKMIVKMMEREDKRSSIKRPTRLVNFADEKLSSAYLTKTQSSKKDLIEVKLDIQRKEQKKVTINSPHPDSNFLLNQINNNKKFSVRNVMNEQTNKSPSKEKDSKNKISANINYQHKVKESEESEESKNNNNQQLLFIDTENCMNDERENKNLNLSYHSNVSKEGRKNQTKTHIKGNQVIFYVNI